MRASRNLLLVAVASVGGLGLGAAGCADDPQYVQPPAGIEVGLGDDQGVGTASLALPFDAAFLTADEDYQDERAELLVALNRQLEAAGQPAIGLEQIPLVRLDQLDISVEWTIKNLSDRDGQARVHLNGGNQYFYYVPANFIVPADPGEEEDPPPPPLAGDIPINLPALGSVSGVFREDQLREAALDLELITRGGLNAFAALLAVHEEIVIDSTADVPFISPDPDNPVAPPPPIPLGAFGHFVRFDLTFVATEHMVFEYSVRIRDHRGLLHDELTAAPAGELMAFAPAEFVPVLPAE